MSSFRKTLLAIAALCAVTGTANAADRATDRFVTAVRGLGAWHGVEVERIAVRGDQYLAIGTNRQGTQVTLVRTCGEGGIACPPALLAARADAPAGVTLGTGAVEGSGR